MITSLAVRNLYISRLAYLIATGRAPSGIPTHETAEAIQHLAAIGILDPLVVDLMATVPPSNVREYLAKGRAA